MGYGSWISLLLRREEKYRRLQPSRNDLCIRYDNQEDFSQWKS